MTGVVRAVPKGQSLQSGIRKLNLPLPPVGTPRLSEAEIVERLEAAGATLLAMPSKGYTTHLWQMRFDIVHTALEAYGWEAAALRPPAPSSSAISAMDEAFGWLALIPEQSFLLRRILGARALVHPLTGRYLYPWRRLAGLLGTDHKSVQRWHANGLKVLCGQLNSRR